MSCPVSANRISDLETAVHLLSYIVRKEESKYHNDVVLKLLIENYILEIKKLRGKA